MAEDKRQFEAKLAEEKRQHAASMAMENKKIAAANARSASGGGGGGGNLTQAEIGRQAQSTMFNDFVNHPDMKHDGKYVSPETYKAFKDKWVGAGFGAGDFDDNFQGRFANPTHLRDYR